MEGRPRVAVVDYGIGNLHSARKALERVGGEAALTSDPDEIAAADGVVLPGVGNVGSCLVAMRERGLEEAVRRAAASVPFLGICVGAQMLFDASDEAPGIEGLGVIPGTVRWLTDEVKRPQMQWNRLAAVAGEPLLEGLGAAPWFYFVHSLHGVPAVDSDVIATCEYGTTVNAAFRRGDVVATQFHPEKSGRNGLALIANYLSSVGDRAA